MTLYQKIAEIISRYPDAAATLTAVDRISPLQIPQISRHFRGLNLHKEELLLIANRPGARPAFILTDRALHPGLPEDAASIALADCNPEVLKTVTNPAEFSAVVDVIAWVLNRKTEVRKTLDSFVSKYREIQEKESANRENPDLAFDGKYVEMLSHESEEAVQLCRNLNEDAHFMQSLNLILQNSPGAVDGYKAEHLMLADLIAVYRQMVVADNEKAMFTLAFYFERLQGNDFTRGIPIGRLNEMATKENFRHNIQKILDSQFIALGPEYRDEYVLPSVLSRMQHLLFIKSGNILYRFASLLAKADNAITEEEKTILKKILDKTTRPQVKPDHIRSREVPEGDSLEHVMAELNRLTGLEEVKKSISDLVNLMQIDRIRREKNLQSPDISLHSVFLGPPGTGKTTVARLLGRIYRHLGYLSKGHVVETDRAGLVAGYVGQTALKVDEVVKQSLGGVLFVDEAYSLAVPDGGRDFGQEAIDALVKRMEDHRNELVVIVAGYTEPLKFFIESNPGLRSRFNRYFVFNHFTPVQLLEIMQSFCRSSDFVVSETASAKLLDIFEMLYEKRDEGFGNARVVRNIFERCVQNQANRLISVQELSEEILRLIDEADVPEPKYMVGQVYLTTEP
jgi:stage V sporulation protein K